MANRPAITIDDDTTNVSVGLTEGNRYTAQNTGVHSIAYANYATDPTNANVGWKILLPKEFLAWEYEATNPLWARIAYKNGRRESSLVISDA